MFRLPFKVYGAAVITKKIKRKKNEKKKFSFETFNENYPPTRHIKYKKIDFVPCNKTIMANKLRSTNLERFIRRIKSPLTR